LSPVVVGTATPDKFPGAELSLLLMMVLTGGLLMAPPSRRSWIVLVGIPGGFTCLIAIVSLSQPIFIARVFCWLGIPLAVLLGHALGTRSKLRLPLVVLTVITGVIGLGYQFLAPQKEPWRNVLDQLGPQLARADAVVLAPQTDPTAFAYYAPNLT